MTQVETKTPVAAGPGPAARSPARISLHGAYVMVEPLDPGEHAEDLWCGLGGVESAELWRYLSSGPFPERAHFNAYLDAKAVSGDPIYFALVDGYAHRTVGHAAYMRINPTDGVIEVGAVVYQAAFQNTRAATEAMYLMARHVFEDLGYQRYEWKCNALNEASQRAALRLGFAFEGVFRQPTAVEGRRRDTAWFAMLDTDWPARKKEFERWLAAENFDRAGRQISRLTHV